MCSLILQIVKKKFLLIYTLYSEWQSGKQNLEMSVNLLKRKKYHIYISIQTLCNNTWNLAQVPPILLITAEMFHTLIGVNCGKLTWFGKAHTIYWWKVFYLK